MIGKLTLFLANGDTTTMYVFCFSSVNQGSNVQYRLAAEGPYYYTSLPWRFEQTELGLAERTHSIPLNL
jgi:hypothetical protein